MSCSGRSRNNAGCSLKRPLLLTSESVPPVLSRWLRFPVSGSARRPRSSEAAPRTSSAVHTPGLHSSVEGQNSGRWRSTAGFWVRDLQQSARHRTPPRSGRALLHRSTILNPVSRPRGLPLGQSPAPGLPLVAAAVDEPPTSFSALSKSLIVLILGCCRCPVGGCCSNCNGRLDLAVGEMCFEALATREGSEEIVGIDQNANSDPRARPWGSDGLEHKHQRSV